MNMKKRILMAGLILAMTISASMTSFAGWKSDDNGWWYEYDDGRYPANSMSFIDGNYYIFDSNGYMLTGWQVYNWYWYYLDPSGKMCTGWQYVGDNWYYLDEDGRMHTYWLYLGNKTYYLNEDGTLRLGDFEDNGIWYTADAVTGEIKKGGKNSGSRNMRYNDDGSVEVYNEETKQWEYMPSVDELVDMQKDTLRYDYLHYKYRSETAFEKAAWEQLTGLISDEEIREFIDDVEDEYDSRQYESYFY